MDRFEEFTTERVYLIGVSQKTADYYRWAFNAWKKHAPNGDPKEFVVSLRQSGVSAISVNTYICAMNTYWKWAGENKHLAYLKEEQKVLATFTSEQVRRIVTFKASGKNLTRAWIVAMVILDCGLRISEVLGIKRHDLDFDNLLIKVKGKGNKERLVPMSIELRKSLYRYVREKQGLVFGTRMGTAVTVRNFQRDFKALCKRLKIEGVRCSPHTLRHSFAVGYLRAGGNLFYLSRILGHTSTRTTERYLQSLGVEDLQAVHSRLSLLTR